MVTHGIYETSSLIKAQCSTLLRSAYIGLNSYEHTGHQCKLVLRLQKQEDKNKNALETV